MIPFFVPFRRFAWRRRASHTTRTGSTARLRALGAAFCCLLLAGCAVSGPRVWFADELAKIFPDRAPGADERADTVWHCARNDYVSIQLAVRAGKSDLEIDAQLTPPAVNGRSFPAEVRWVDYVPVGSNPPRTPYDEVLREAPALFPDPLRHDFPFRLEAGRTGAVWVTIYCPPDTPPGDYEGEILLSADERELARRSFVLRVHSATVPSEQTLHVTNWFNFSMDNLRRFYDVEEYSEEYWELLGNIGRVMAEHKQNVILTPVARLAEPSVAGGRIRYDFSRLDRWVETFEKAGVIGIIEGGHLLGRSGGYFEPIVVPAWVVEGGRAVRRHLDPDDPRAERYLRGFLTALYAHLNERGWQDRYIQHVHDEPHDREAPIYRRFAQLVLETMPGIPTIDAVSLNQDISFFADVCKIWVPVLGSFDHRMKMIRDHVAAGGRAWFYTCVSPQGRYLNRFIDYSLLKVRLLHWFNFRHGFTGFLHWGGNYWGPRPFENVQQVINNNRTLLPAGDHAIVYPDPERNSVLSSIRLEAMRDGVEDFELLAALAKTNPELARQLAAEAIPHINDYVRDPAAFRRIHRRLLEAFE